MDLCYGLESSAIGLRCILGMATIEPFCYTYQAVRDLLMRHCGGRLDELIQFVAPEEVVD